MPDIWTDGELNRTSRLCMSIEGWKDVCVSWDWVTLECGCVYGPSRVNMRWTNTIFDWCLSYGWAVWGWHTHITPHTRDLFVNKSNQMPAPCPRFAQKLCEYILQKAVTLVFIERHFATDVQLQLNTKPHTLTRCWCVSSVLRCLLEFLINIVFLNFSMVFKLRWLGATINTHTHTNTHYRQS